MGVRVGVVDEYRIQFGPVSDEHFAADRLEHDPHRPAHLRGDPERPQRLERLEIVQAVPYQTHFLTEDLECFGLDRSDYRVV